TVIGNLLRTELQDHFNRRLYVETGALLQHPFGDDDRIAEADPVISLNYRLTPDWLITAGTIDRDHPLHDAIFWELLRFTDPIEQGFQIKGDSKFLRQDLWLNWEQRETATRREKFSIGNFTELKWKGFHLDGQVYWVHLGGQKNSGPGVFNNLSLGFGGGYSWQNDREDLSFLQGAGAAVHYLYQKDEPPLAAKLEGDGIAARVWVDVMGFNVYFLNWDAGDPGFHSRRGDAAMPGVALAKGNPLYGADDFQEVGISRLWPLADAVHLRLDLRQQFVQDQMVEVYALTVQWREDFDLFANFFRRHGKGAREAASRPSRLHRRAPAPASRLRP
ncbi:MAG: hypothetical protein ACE5ER_00965, partial [Nitrospinaceae bacterium]